MKMDWKFSCVKMRPGFYEPFTCILRYKRKFLDGNFSFYYRCLERSLIRPAIVTLGGQCLDFLKEMHLKLCSKGKVPCKMKASLLALVLSLLRMNMCLELVLEEHPSKVCLTNILGRTS